MGQGDLLRVGSGAGRGRAFPVEREAKRETGWQLGCREAFVSGEQRGRRVGGSSDNILDKEEGLRGLETWEIQKDPMDSHFSKLCYRLSRNTWVVLTCK